MGKLLFFLLLIISIKVGAQNKLGFALEEGRRKVDIPFELYNNLVVVPVVVNEALPLKFVVDTGVQTGILTQKSFSDILHLPYSRKYVISGPGSEKEVQAYITNNVSLRLPGIYGKGHALLVLEEDYLELRNHLGTDVQGILGYELFSRFVIKFNYERKVMTVYEAAYFKKKKKYQEMRLRIESTKPFLFTKVCLTDSTCVPLKLLVDSGASHGLLLDPISSDSISPPAKTVSSAIGRGIGGEITGKIGRIKGIKMADYLIESPVVSFPDPNSYIDSIKLGGTFRNGTIGGEILSRFHVIFDFPNEKLYIKKNGDFRKKFYYNLSGLTIRAVGHFLDSFEITNVRRNSSAHLAGLKKGDQILSLNNTFASDLNLGNVNAILNSRPGKRIMLRIQRGNKQYMVKFTLESEI